LPQFHGLVCAPSHPPNNSLALDKRICTIDLLRRSPVPFHSRPAFRDKLHPNRINQVPSRTGHLVDSTRTRKSLRTFFFTPPVGPTATHNPLPGGAFAQGRGIPSAIQPIGRRSHDMGAGAWASGSAKSADGRTAGPRPPPALTSSASRESSASRSSLLVSVSTAPSSATAGRALLACR